MKLAARHFAVATLAVTGLRGAMPATFRLSILLCLAAIQPVKAAEVMVSPAPAALTQAIQNAAEGDTLVLQPGIYREQVRIEKKLTLRGNPGAVLDGSEELKVEWSPAGGGLRDVYVATLPKRPYGLLTNGKFLAEMRHDRADEEGDWHWRKLLAKGTPLSGFSEVKALWIYQPKEQKLFARFENGVAPSTLKLSFLKSKDALLTISRASGVIIKGLTFAHGFTAIEMTEGATQAKIQNCKITSYESTGIEITDGASHCTIEFCTLTRGALEEWQPSQSNNKPNYEIWRIHKDVGNYDRVGINLFRAGRGNRILNNHLDRVFDGICVGDYKTESLDDPAGDPEHGRGTEIAGNVIENTRDSGIELGTACIDVNVHHNTLRRTHGGLRFKVPRTGPVFIHHNRLINSAPFNIWFSMDASPAEGYVYHNTIVSEGGRSAVEYSSFKKTRDTASPNWHFLNNLVLSKEGFFDRSGKTPAADFKAAHNIVTGKSPPWPDDAARDPGSRYEVTIMHDPEGRPEAGSAAMDAGLDLSTYRHGKALPGCESGYFKGQAPDAGVDEAAVK
jgi:hypothetical protein